MKKIFCFINGGTPGLLNAVALAEDGTYLACHGSSCDGWAQHDLGIESIWKHAEYNAHYGEGKWKLEWVFDPKTHEGLNAAIKLNQEKAQKEKEVKK